MQATVGDRIRIRSQSGASADGEIVEVKGQNGEPPYLVMFDDGHHSLIYPGPNSNCEINPEA
ncbi:DUF1918 domain-containing protein [Streptomyces tendae]|uniref:DUF1918 domain-containing protein n=1 Tax=Streptomyces tendae TaxID=1932 RepID=A0A6B3QSY2_STRTE|nr:DUF1918 domain-containing protein [Streptomyces tendae]NEV89224.1 DUF1918 domain-containing protein [Streptomyces tendae]